MVTLDLNASIGSDSEQALRVLNGLKDDADTLESRLGDLGDHGLTAQVKHENGELIIQVQNQ